MMTRKFFLAAGLAAALLQAGSAAALDSAGLHRNLQQFMRGYSDKLLSLHGADTRVEYRINLDSRLQLADCPVPLVFKPRDQGPLSARLSVQVSCTSGNPWSIHVPVDLSIYQPVVTAVKPLARGLAIGSADVQLAEADITRLNGRYLSHLDAAIGMDVKRPVAQGGAIVAEQLEPPLQIRRGEAVVISADTGSIGVKMHGIALSDGRRGEQIRIRNKTSNRIVQAKVTGPGLAAITL